MDAPTLEHQTRKDFDEFLDIFKEEVEDSYNKNEDPNLDLMKTIAPDTTLTLWHTGCFIQHVFDVYDLPEEDMQRVQFASGQRSFLKGTDAMIDIALSVLNAYLDGVDPNPGRELGEQVFDEIFGPMEGT